jgi:N-acetylglutamate synthase-like GNAT family acetyltransferase
MNIRKARREDAPTVRALAVSLGLDYPGMESDPAWIAEAEGRLAGSVSLRTHPDSFELVALGIDPAFRGRGLGKRLVRALCDDTDGEIHLATVIPGFFARCGFVRIARGPSGMAKDAVWCEGCDRAKCAIMVRRRS